MGQALRQENRFIDGKNDITEKDLVRQKYYKLMAEQAVWNIQKQEKKGFLSKLSLA